MLYILLLYARLIVISDVVMLSMNCNQINTKVERFIHKQFLNIIHYMNVVTVDRQTVFRVTHLKFRAFCQNQAREDANRKYL